MGWLFKAIASHKSIWLPQVDFFLKMMEEVFYLFNTSFRQGFA